MNLSNTLEFGKLTEYELDSFAHPGYRDQYRFDCDGLLHSR
jgi:hypothetical protein